MKETMFVGVDLGGTKIEALAMDRSGKELLRRRTATPTEGYDAILGVTIDLVRGLESALGREGTVGVGTPGAISPATGMIKNSNTAALIGRPLDKDLERLLGRPVRLENDANCFAVSEATDGAGAGAEVVFGVIVGTGTGGGIVVHGRPIRGAHAIAGEWGHNPLPWPRPEELPGPACYCGRRGCIETFLSGPGLSRDFREATGRTLIAEAIAAGAVRGVPECVAAMERYEDRMARALASVVNLLDPDVIVLGGGLSNIDRLYDAVPRRWAARVFSDEVHTRLVRAKHGDSSGVRGAAWLWK